MPVTDLGQIPLSLCDALTWSRIECESAPVPVAGRLSQVGSIAHSAAVTAVNALAGLLVGLFLWVLSFVRSRVARVIRGRRTG